MSLFKQGYLEVVQVLDNLWGKKSKYRQLLQAAKDKDVSIFYFENGECLIAVNNAWLQRAAIVQAEHKIAYEAYKDFREFGRGAVLISPVELIYEAKAKSKSELASGPVFVTYRSKQQILDSRNALPADFRLIDDLLLDKIDQYDPETEAVVGFFVVPAVVLIHFRDFEMKPQDCYKKLAFLEMCLS